MQMPSYNFQSQTNCCGDVFRGACEHTPYHLSSPLLVANDSVSMPMLLSMLTNKLHNGMLFFLS